MKEITIEPTPEEIVAMSDIIDKHYPNSDYVTYSDIRAMMFEYAASLNRQGWTRVEDGKVESMPPDCTVVLGYNEKWVDEDFEPEGIRECFYSEAMGEWNSAKWDNDQDHWWNDTETSPTHWMQRPDKPSNI